MATATVTRKSVLTAVKEGKGYADLKPAEREVFDKILASVSKKSVPTVSKTHIANRNDARKFAESLAAGQVFDTALVRSKVQFCNSASKATAVILAGVADGLFVSHKLARKTGGRGKGYTVYQLMCDDPVWGDEPEEEEEK